MRPPLPDHFDPLRSGRSATTLVAASMLLQAGCAPIGNEVHGSVRGYEFGAIWTAFMDTGRYAGAEAPVPVIYLADRRWSCASLQARAGSGALWQDDSGEDAAVVVLTFALAEASCDGGCLPIPPSAPGVFEVVPPNDPLEDGARFLPFVAMSIKRPDEVDLQLYADAGSVLLETLRPDEAASGSFSLEIEGEMLEGSFDVSLCELPDP